MDLSVCATILDRRRALVVDDDPAVCEMLAGILASLGMTADTHVSAESVLENDSGVCYGLAFLDLGLPGQGGLELAEQLRRDRRVEDIVFMSSRGTFEKLFKAIKIGAYDYLKKPLSSSEVRLLLSRYSERMELLQRMNDAEHRHMALLENVPLLIFTLGRSFSLQYVNHAAETLLGYKTNEALQADSWLLERVHPNDRKKVREAFVYTLSGRGEISLECRMLHRKGSVLHGIIRTIPCAEDDGSRRCSSERVDGVFVDITDRVYLERALIQNEKLKTLGAISAEVAHEIRNPLMSIAGFARRLEKKSPDSPEVGIILRESMRLEKLLNRIRDYLRPVEVNTEECDVNAIVSESVSLLFPEMETLGVWVQLDLAEHLPPVAADREVLSQVCINLIRHALRSLDQDSSFILRSFSTEHNVHLEFRSQASPDAEFNPELLFMPFDEGGQSFGLPLSYRLVKNMGGLLTYTQDHGSDVFTISLPRSGEDAVSEPPVRPDNEDQRFCFDSETGLLTAKRFSDLLGRAIRQAVREERTLSVAVFELDTLHAYQEVAGDAAADDVLNRVGAILSDILCSGVYLPSARDDGGFAAILPDADPGVTKDLVSRIARAVEGLHLPMGNGREASLTAGAVTTRPARGQQPEDLLSAAVRELHRARAEGANWRVKNLLDV